MKYLYLWCMLLVGGSTAWAQSSDARANRFYNDLGYAQYIQLKGGSNWLSQDLPTLIKLATSYRKVADFKNAERAYRAVLDKGGDDPMYHLYYAQALQSNGFYGKASEQYRIALEKMSAESDGEEKPADERPQEGMKACLQPHIFRAKGFVKLYNVEAINSPDLDFSPMYYDGGLVFVSTREDASLDKIDPWLNDNCMDLYFAPIEAGIEQLPKPFADELNTTLHEGPVSFTDDEQKIFFTRNNYKNGKRGVSKKRITKLKIYTAERKKDQWKNIEELPFNDNEIDVCHPALSADERILVFASSKGEGHQGGMDLYASFWAGENWSTPVNLGPEINTAGDEAFPYLYRDGSLYFSSTGHGGLGGLDLFVALPMGDNDEEQRWRFPINIGAPFNSPYDDFGLILNKEENAGYLTSNRIGGQGKDDIYRFTIQSASLATVKPRPSFPIQICVYDKRTNERLEGAQVTIRRTNQLPADQREALGIAPGQDVVLRLKPLNPGTNEYTIQLRSANQGERDEGGNKIEGRRYTTNNEGIFPYQLYGRENYMLEVQKAGYVTVQEYLTMPADGDLEEFCVGILKRSDLLLADLDPNGNPNNFGTDPNNPNNPNNPDGTSGSGLPIDPNTGAPLDPSRLLGPDDRPLPSGQPYVAGIVLNKEYNRPLPRTKVTLFNRCTGEEQVYEVDQTGRFAFSLECGCDYVLKGRKDRFIGANKVLGLVKAEDCKPVVTELVLTPGFDKLGTPITIGGQTITETLKEGDMIEIRDIYYDFDQYYIRDDASDDLNRLVALLLQFPSMKIELSSHTDSRGTDAYNNTLSSNRAKAARAYLTRKGIAPERIVAVGYGEQRPRNNCRDGVDCNEYEHQRNRRTEVLITAFDQAEYIRVYYEKNEPTKVDPKRN